MTTTLLRPGENVWRIERAHRAAVLVDGANYFAAVRAALRNARRSVFILGWDIHSRVRLVGENGSADDGYPECFADFLSALVQERPALNVFLLLWDYSVLYAAERELFPTYTLRWNTPRRVRFCLDDAVPIGSSQHQKLIVVDDAVAFSGGLDVTVRRWDNSEHAPDNPARIDPAGRPYRPFHDVQIVVDGDAARALAKLAHARWQCAAYEAIPMVHGPESEIEDAWPQTVRPDFINVDVGIARTQPAYEEQADVREVLRLFLDSIAQAERSIYIENQFLSCARIAHALAQRMTERPQLETVIVAPGTHDSWLEARSMRNGRIRFMNVLREAGVADRVRLLHPVVGERHRHTRTMVHSKVMIVDDRLLRVGSANLNNRSMGTDTECDLAIEGHSAVERARITEIRDRLLADHCGARVAEVAQALAQSGSLAQVAETLTRRGHCLVPIDDGVPDRNDLSAYIEGVADLERPIGAEEFVSKMLGGVVQPREVPSFAKLCTAAVGLLLLVLAWRFSPLAALATPDVVTEALEDFARGPWQPVVVLLAFIGGGLVLFPVTILIAATAAAFGPWLGFLYGTIGALSSALLTYALGARLGKDSLRDFLGPRLNRIRERIARQGMIAVASIRLIPLAPFTVVNLVAGASEIRLSDYMLGTFIGMLPGLIAMSALGHQVSRIIADPSLLEFVLLFAALAVWIGLSIGLQVLVARLGSSRT